ncbi:hypothetical protein EDD29_7657 [Actinocorallia herbida]|uniref:DUF8094 domain-containing protein n=1 Tax=Actinocorallia herbida TaxID=58109 RepID=A0A3N1D8U5_9ACTN|nr:hypothetical protein [Actinocorallia herbida]ROO89945.1 hypothetical protein EDD29_7657 [Actinocorallia herbida]
MRITVICAAALLLASGCAGAAEPPRVASIPMAASSADTPLTPESAATAFRTWTVNDDLARASADGLLAQSWSEDSQLGVGAAEFRAAAAAGKTPVRHGYGKPALWVPRLTGYPQWFVASVERDGSRVLMAFIRKNPDARFRLSIAVTPGKGVKLPKVPVDEEGYAALVDSADQQGLLTSPGAVASLQAAVADEGPGSFSARVLKGGPYTTGLFSAHEKAAQKAAKDGLRRTSTFTVPVQPVFALRTSDGSALVLYPLTSDTTTARKDASDTAPLPLPKEFAHLMPLGGGVSREIEATETHEIGSLQFAAVVPAYKGGDERPKAAVIAHGGGVTRINSS